jgi:hypothetical protein
MERKATKPSAQELFRFGRTRQTAIDHDEV